MTGPLPACRTTDDALDPVATGFMLGAWLGHEFPSGHA